MEEKRTLDAIYAISFTVFYGSFIMGILGHFILFIATFVGSECFSNYNQTSTSDQYSSNYPTNVTSQLRYMNLSGFIVLFIVTAAIMHSHYI